MQYQVYIYGDGRPSKAARSEIVDTHLPPACLPYVSDLAVPHLFLTFDVFHCLADWTRCAADRSLAGLTSYLSLLTGRTGLGPPLKHII